MILTPLALAGVLHTCAPLAKPGTMASVALVESSFDPNAIHDDSTGREYHPSSREEALALLEQLAGHPIDVGVVQVHFQTGVDAPRTVTYFVCAPKSGAVDRMCGRGRVRLYRTYTLTAVDALDPCRDAFAGMAILQEAWEKSTSDFAALSDQLAGAIALYNTGSSYAAPDYVGKVVEAARAHEVLLVAAYADALALQDDQAAAHKLKGNRT